MTETEADTCRRYVVPALQAAGWDADPHSIAEQRTITDGRIVPVGRGFVRKPPKRVDFLLRYRRDFPLAVVEAKAGYKSAADGVQQAQAICGDAGAEVRLCDERPRNYRVRLLHRGRDAAHLLPGAGRALGTAIARARASRAIRQPIACSPLSITPSARTNATTSRSRSTASSRPSSRASVACSSPWRPAPARPRSRSRSAGSSGTAAGTATANIAAEDPLPGRPQHPRRPTEGRHLRRLRRRPLQDRIAARSSWAARSTSRSTRRSPRTSAGEAYSGLSHPISST